MPAVTGAPEHASGSRFIVRLNDLYSDQDQEPLDRKEVARIARGIRKGERPVVYVIKRDDHTPDSPQPLAIANPLGRLRAHAYLKARIAGVPIMAMHPDAAADVAEIAGKITAPEVKMTVPAMQPEIIMPNAGQVAAIAAEARKQLAATAVEIKQLHADVQDGLRQTLPKAIRIGELLTEAKPKIAHGHWLTWIEEHCDFDERVAQRYMRLAKHKGEIEANTIPVSYLGVKSATKAIAKPRRSASSKPTSKKKTTTTDETTAKTTTAAVTVWKDETPGETITVHVGRDATVLTTAEASQEPLAEPEPEVVDDDETFQPLVDGRGRRMSANASPSASSAGPTCWTTQSTRCAVCTTRRTRWPTTEW